MLRCAASKISSLELVVMKDYADRDLSKAEADAEFAAAFKRLDEESAPEGEVSDAERAWWWLRWNRAGELLAKVMSDEQLPRRDRVRKKMAAAAAAVARHETDVGSPEVQVVRLTERIAAMQEHLKMHKKDRHGRRGLQAMMIRRRKEMKYLRRTNAERYEWLLSTTGLLDRMSQPTVPGLQEKVQAKKAKAERMLRNRRLKAERLKRRKRDTRQRNY